MYNFIEIPLYIIFERFGALFCFFSFFFCNPSDSFIKGSKFTPFYKMAKLRKACAYRRLERPYTRRSKYRKLSFIKSSPSSKIVRFECGNLSRKFEKSVDLVSKGSLQIRNNAIESARQTSNKLLEKNLGKTGFRMGIRIFPHHILRENPLASGAGADRMSTGMAHSFGKAIGSAAQVKEGQALITVSVDKQNIEVAKQALKRASYKFPCACTIAIRDNKI
jgi:large subunit ribosomal protein L10e